MAIIKPESNLISIKTALLFAGTVSIVMVLAAALQPWLGKEGVIAGAAIAGYADTHSAAVAVASLDTAGKLIANEAVLPILTSLTTNTITKIVLASLSVNWRFIGAIIPGLILVIVAAWIGGYTQQYVGKMQTGFWNFKEKIKKGQKVIGNNQLKPPQKVWPDLFQSALIGAAFLFG